MEENNEKEPIEIELDEEQSKILNQLTKEITSYERQNMIMSFIHILLLLFCLVLGTTFVIKLADDTTYASSMALTMIAAVEVIDIIAYKMIINMNNKKKDETKEKIKEMVRKKMDESKGNIFDTRA